MKMILLFTMLISMPLIGMDGNDQLVRVKREPGLIEEVDQHSVKRAAVVLINERQVDETNGTDRTMLVSHADNSGFDRAVLTRSQDGLAAIDLEEEPFASMGNEQSNKKRGRNAEDFDLEALADLGAVKKERIDAGSVENVNQVNSLSAWHKPYCGTVEELKLLLAETIYPADEHGWTILHGVVLAGNMPCLTYLLDRLKNDFLKQAIELQDENGHRALHVAVFYRQRDCLEALLKAGAAYDVADKFAKTPLIYAFRMEQVLCAEELVKAGASLLWRGAGRETLLHIIAGGGARVSVKFLLEKGLAVDALDKDGRTPLYYALWRNRVACAEELIKAGACVDVRIRGEVTLLHVAAFSGALKSVKFLLAKGLDPDAKNFAGKTPAMLAIEKGHKECAEELNRASLLRRGHPG